MAWKVRGSNPGGGARLSAPIQTSPGGHPASYTMDTRSLYQGQSSWGMVMNTHPQTSAKVKERVVITLIPLWAFVTSSRVNITLLSEAHILPPLAKTWTTE